MAIPASTLMAEASCFCPSGASNTELMILALERRWLLEVDPAADVSPAELMEEANCYCGVGGSIAQRFQMALLGKIAEA